MNKNKPIAWVLAALLLYLVFSSSGERGLLHTKATDYDLVARNRTSSAKPRRLVAAVGLSRTGTSSLTAALALLNYTTAHAEETVDKHLDFWHYFLSGRIGANTGRAVYAAPPRPGDLFASWFSHRDGDVDDVPTNYTGIDVRGLLRPYNIDFVSDCFLGASLVGDILREENYPDAQVILTTRELDSWLRSYRKYVDGSDLYHTWRLWPRLALSRISRALRLGPIFRAVGVIPKDSPDADPRSGFALERLPILMRVWRQVDSLFYGNTALGPLWKVAHERHLAHVRALVAEAQTRHASKNPDSSLRPPSLLEIDLVSPDVDSYTKWKRLLDFLDPDDLPAQLRTAAERELWAREVKFPRAFAATQVTSSTGTAGASAAATRVHERATLAVVALLALVVVAVWHVPTSEVRLGKGPVERAKRHRE